MTTLTQRKRLRFLKRYAIKDARTKVYRALYGELIADSEGKFVSDKGSPETKASRRLPQDFSYSRAESVFRALAEKEAMVDGKRTIVSNGLFPPQQYAALVHRLDVLRKVYRS